MGARTGARAITVASSDGAATWNMRSASGHAAAYRTLGSCTASPVYGAIHPHLHMGTDVVTTTLEEIADMWASSFLSHNSSAAYILIGASLGGLIAHLVTRSASQRGNTPISVVLIDPAPLTRVQDGPSLPGMRAPPRPSLPGVRAPPVCPFLASGPPCPVRPASPRDDENTFRKLSCARRRRRRPPRRRGARAEPCKFTRAAAGTDGRKESLPLVAGSSPRRKWL